MKTIEQNSLSILQNCLARGDEFIPLDAIVYPTKGKSGKVSGFFLRDKLVENRVHNQIKDFGVDIIIERYRKSYPSLEFYELPHHYPVNTNKIEGVLSSGKNIFLFFPEALGVQARQVQDYFGFEFIDVWKDIFTQIVLPCTEKTFVPEQFLDITKILSKNLEDTIFMAAVFHEFGHRIGPWRISPSKDPNIKVKKFYLDVIGELITDALLVEKLFEFKNLALFVLLERLFWFGRTGFNLNQRSGMLNEDNDCWIGSYLWNKFKKEGCIYAVDAERWAINFELIHIVFRKISYEVEELGNILISISPEKQNSLVMEWMCSNLEYDSNVGFILPVDFSLLLKKCKHIPYFPILHTHTS